MARGVEAKTKKSSATEDMRGSPATPHPDLVEMLPDYREMRDTRAGARVVKEQSEVYLPKPTGFKGSADGGVDLYSSYLKRAQFPEIVSPTILGMSGVIHRREPTIEGLEEGKPLAGLWETATLDGLPLEALWARITEEILTIGRCALLADVATEGGDTPYIAVYTGETLINWSDERNFFVLEEQYRVRSGYSWDTQKRYRVLTLSETGTYQVRVVDESGEPQMYVAAGAAHEEGEPERETDYLEPRARGGRTLEEIPLVVVGARDLSLKPDEMPLIGVARAALAIYRLDADYRHQLFMSGQETLFVFGMDPKDTPTYVGAGVIVCIPDEGEARYVGPSGVGIAAHKTAIEDERENAASAGARMFDTQKRGAESGDALRIRSRATTATLVSVAIASAAALEKVLRHCATMVGQDPEEIVVTPNLDFVDSPLTPTDAKALMELWLGKVISYETLYENLRRGDIASQERTAEEEQEAIGEEEAQFADEAAAMGKDPEAETDGDDEYPAEPDEDELSEIFDPELLAEGE